MAIFRFFLLAHAIISLQMVIVESLHHCYAFGNPHLVRFPVNEQEKEHDRSVWCKNTGVQWLTWNKYAAVSIRIGKHPFSIIDFNIVIYHDDGSIALTLNTNQFEIASSYMNGNHSSLHNIATNMIYSKWEDGFSFNYLDAKFTVIVTRSQYSSGQYHYNIDIGQSMCLIKHSNGLCRTGCRLKRQARRTNKTPLEIQISQKAMNICDIYMNNFMRQISNSLTQIEINNARHSCIIDMTETGDIRVAHGIIDLMAVQIASSNITQIAATVKDSFSQSYSEVEKILDLVINSTVFRWLEDETCVCGDFNIEYDIFPSIEIKVYSHNMIGYEIDQ